MLRQISILLEILAVFVCIHRLYGKRIKANIETAAAYLGCLVIYSAMDKYQFRIMLSLVAYLIVTIFCVHSLKDSIKGAVLSIVLTVIIIAVMQFACMLPLNIFLKDENHKAFGINLLVLISFAAIVPKHKLCSLRKVAGKYNIFAMLMLGGGLYIAFLLLLREVLSGRLFLRLFVFLVLIVSLSFLAIEKWNEVQCEKENMKKALQVTEAMPEKYDELIKTIRMRQHEFKNHLVAILAAQYTYKSYDKLVKIQNEYCGKLIQENKHCDLLLISNRTLAGFLYGKFQEIESMGMNVECQIKGTFRQSVVPTHRLIEILGILLDNAVQSMQNEVIEGADIRFGFLEKKEDCQFKISNKFPYTSYDEIEGWFQMGKSTKGENRGIGLYHLRCLCKELGCEILCRNVEIEEENWIEFVLEVHKADIE